MDNNEKIIIYYDVEISSNRFFKINRPKIITNHAIYDTAAEALEGYPSIVAKPNCIWSSIKITKGGKELKYYELQELAVEEADGFIILDFHSTSETTLFKIKINKETSDTTIEVEDIKKMMFLLDTNTDFNISFKLFADVRNGLSYFESEDTVNIINDCFSMPISEGVIKVM